MFPAIVTLPVRAVLPGFAAALKVTVPLPDPDDPPETVSQESLLVADQLQPAGAVTPTLVDSPPTAKAFEPGEMVSLQATPTCVALKVLPATVTVPVRAVLPGFAVALNITVPFPEPEVPAMTVIHPELLTADQLQPPGAVTATLVDSPATANAFDPGEIVSLQPTPACVALKVLPAIVTVPDRDALLVFAAAVRVTVPLPEPEGPAVTVTQAALLVADQPQPAGAVTPTLVDSPSTAKAFEPGEMVSVQATPTCVALKVLPAIVTVPVRAVLAGFAAALKVTVPLPEPEAPPVTVIQESLLVADQLQPVGAVTATPVDSPATANAFDPGEIVSVQAAPTWLALKVLPAMVTVPVRGVLPGFAEALSVTVPLPEPEAPPVTVIHPELLTADQLQPVGAVTAMLVDSPATANAADPGEIVSVQVMPACVAVKVRPAIVAEPVRDAVPVFAAAVTVTDPLADPLAPAVIVIHPEPLVAVQPQPAGAVTATVASSPAVANALDDGEMVSLQLRAA